MEKIDNSLKVLIAGSICFIVGFVIFAVALFARLSNVEVYATIGLILIVVFLILTFISMRMREKEKNEAEKN